MKAAPASAPRGRPRRTAPADTLLTTAHVRTALWLEHGVRPGSTHQQQHTPRLRTRPTPLRAGPGAEWGLHRGPVSGSRVSLFPLGAEITIAA